MVSKLLFLSDRLYAQLEEEETREYELGRVTEILGLTPQVWVLGRGVSVCVCVCMCVCRGGGDLLGLMPEVGAWVGPG